VTAVDFSNLPVLTGPLLELVQGGGRSSTPVHRSLKERLLALQGLGDSVGGDWARTALHRELESLRATPRGQRNHALNSAGFSLHQIAQEGLLDPEEVDGQLRTAAMEIGLEGHEIELTLASARRGAASHPRPPEQLPTRPITPDAASRRPHELEAKETTSEIDEPARDNWPEPTPLESVSTLPAFPLDSLPEWLSRYVLGLSTEKQVAPDLAAMLSLAVLATVVGGYVFADVRPGWTEPSNLYALVALPSGERKSPVLADLLAPLTELETELLVAARDDIARAEADLDLAERKLTELKKDALKAKSATEQITARGLVLEAAEEVAQLRDSVPVRPRLWTDDVTPEALGELLAEQGGRLGLLSAEGGVFDAMSGRYDSRGGKGPAKASLDVWLKAYSGEAIRVDRRGDQAPLTVERACLTIGVAVQPDVLNGLARVPGFKSRGLLGRFIMALPESLVGTRCVTPEPCNQTTRDEWRQRMLDLGRLVRQRGHVAVTFSPAAVDALVRFYAATEPRLAGDGDLAVVTEWAAKLHGQVARLAALLHLADTGTSGLDTPVGCEQVERAVAIGEYLIPHALAAHDLMGADEEMTKARDALRLISRKGWTNLKPRDLQHAQKSRFPKADDARSALAVLSEYEWVRQADDGSWDVNPAAHR